MNGILSGNFINSLGFFGGGKTFIPDQDIPDLSGKVILVTGGTAGLGNDCCVEIAKHGPAHVYIAGRKQDAADSLIAVSASICVLEGAKMEIKTQNATVSVSFLQLDLASFESIRTAAKKVVEESGRLDILMNNAGCAALSPGLTKEGYELQFGINHVGHALLTKLLLPTLLKTAELAGSDVRVLTLTSSGHMLAPPAGIVFDDLKTTQETIGRNAPWMRYGQSKLANIHFAAELAARYPQMTSLSIHPGIIKDTGIWNKAEYGNVLDKMVMEAYFWLLDTPPANGIKNQLWGAFGAKKEIINGEFYMPIGVVGKGTANARNKELGRRLWEWTEKELAGQSL